MRLGRVHGSRQAGPHDPAPDDDAGTVSALSRAARARQAAARMFRPREPGSAVARLGDFTATPRIIMTTGIAVAIGVVVAGVAWALLRLIGFFTNLFFFQRISTSMASPADSSLGLGILVVPIIGALLVGVIARFGSEKVRGHGIPEAMDAVLNQSSRVEPKVALLKPLSAAIAIGSGGPFGAEGPIIMTGGAMGSIFAQFSHLTGGERKTLLAAGAAAGMSAVFDAPIAAVLLTIELLLFEWRPRSVIPVAMASAVAAVARRYMLGDGPVFPTPVHAPLDAKGLLACVLVGLLAGVLSLALTVAIYAVEDAYARIPIHWMWWPAIGAVSIGVGGYFFPEALGVGYANIGALLAGSATTRLILGILIIKSLMWTISLGSGTSGGILAPILMIGGSLGGVEASFLPGYGPGFWPMVSMGAVLGGTMRAPLTGIVFSLELTHDMNSVVPLIVAGMVSYGFTVLVLKRSILTEKLSRRGHHMRWELEVDPLEVTRVRDVMRPGADVLSSTLPLRAIEDALLQHDGHSRTQRLYAVVDEGGALVGVAARDELVRLSREYATSPQNGANGRGGALGEHVTGKAVVAYEDEPLRIVAYRMANTGFTRMPVVSRGDATRPIGLIALADMLAPRARISREEHHRERVLKLSSLLRPRSSKGQPVSPQTKG